MKISIYKLFLLTTLLTVINSSPLDKVLYQATLNKKDKIEVKTISQLITTSLTSDYEFLNFHSSDSDYIISTLSGDEDFINDLIIFEDNTNLTIFLTSDFSNSSTHSATVDIHIYIYIVKEDSRQYEGEMSLIEAKEALTTNSTKKVEIILTKEKKVLSEDQLNLLNKKIIHFKEVKSKAIKTHKDIRATIKENIALKGGVAYDGRVDIKELEEELKILLEHKETLETTLRMLSPPNLYIKELTKESKKELDEMIEQASRYNIDIKKLIEENHKLINEVYKVFMKEPTHQNRDNILESFNKKINEFEEFFPVVETYFIERKKEIKDFELTEEIIFEYTTKLEKHKKTLKFYLDFFQSILTQLNTHFNKEEIIEFRNKINRYMEDLGKLMDEIENLITLYNEKLNKNNMAYFEALSHQENTLSRFNKFVKKFKETQSRITSENIEIKNQEATYENIRDSLLNLSDNLTDLEVFKDNFNHQKKVNKPQTILRYGFNKKELEDYYNELDIYIKDLEKLTEDTKKLIEDFNKFLLANFPQKLEESKNKNLDVRSVLNKFESLLVEEKE